MTAFVQEMLTVAFLRNALIAGVLASVACGIIGAYVTVQRRSYIAGAVAHSCLGGMGLAMYLNRVHQIRAATPLLGALMHAVLVALLIGLIVLRGRERVDTVLSAIWAIGMAAGLAFMRFTPGYNEDLMSYLFGYLLLVPTSDLWLMGLLDLVVLATTVFFFNKFLAVAFDEEYARLRGLNVAFYTLLQMVLVALTIVMLVQVVGIILAIAVLTLPAATASRLTRRLWLIMLLAGLITLASVTAGLVWDYAYDFPASVTAVLLAGGAYLLVFGGGALAHRLRRRA